MTPIQPILPHEGEPQDDADMFETLLLKYHRDELSDAERTWLHGYTATHEAARLEFRLLDSLPEALQACTPAAHSRVGIDRVMQRIANSSPTRKSFFSQISDWLGGTVSSKAFAGACAVIALQFGLFGALVHNASDSETEEAKQFRAVQTTVVTHVALRVNFKENTTERDMRFLLVSNGARIVAGPTQLGSYFLTVRKGGEPALAQALNASPLIASVQVDVQLPDD